jgi:hypothetical protein
MSKLPLVSVIIVNYNGQKYLADCLDSLSKTNYPRFEIIVVDNASTDGSQKYLKAKMLNVKTNVKSKSLKNNHQSSSFKLQVIFNKENLGFAAANNQGTKIARGIKLVFLNNDTLVEKNWLKELVKFSLKNPKYLVQPKILFWPQKNIIDNVGGIYRFPGFGFGRGRGENDKGQFNQSVPVDYVNGTCFLIDKNFFHRLGNFDESYFLHYEDVDLNLRAKKAGGESWYCYKSVIYHKGSLTVKSQISKEKLLFNIRKNRLRAIVKNFNGWSKILRVCSLLSYCPRLSYFQAREDVFNIQVNPCQFKPYSSYYSSNIIFP